MTDAPAPDALSHDLTSRDTYRYWTRDVVRFQDLDRVGHVNNIAFAVYCETGRVEFLEHVMPGSVSGHGVGWVIVKLTVDFRAQAHYPGGVEIGTHVLKIGRSSCILGTGLFKDGVCFGTAESVCVYTDIKASKGVALSDEHKAALQVYA
jgi:acyl-CoA thioester hydrolase